MRAYEKKRRVMVEARKRMEQAIREKHPGATPCQVRKTAEIYVRKAMNEISEQRADGVLSAEAGEAGTANGL